MGEFKDKDGVFKFGKDRNDGSFRQDRMNYTDKSAGKHDHSWSKTDPTTGRHKEGYKGPNVPKGK